MKELLARMLHSLPYRGAPHVGSGSTNVVYRSVKGWARENQQNSDANTPGVMGLD